MDAERKSLKLRSLAPEYNPEHHGIYLNALEDALGDESMMRNIALTGAYGTGKSSILDALEKNYESRLLVLSLSTLGSDEADPPAEDGPSGPISSKTNRIQQEIVKQILYRDAPGRMRASRFRRIVRFIPRREVPLALAIGLLATVALYLSGWSGPLSQDDARGWRWILTEHLAVAALVASAVYGLRRWANGRLVLEKLNAGPATVSVASQTTSYFDQYMDEIVYYFEESGRDIVIFEDIDRFDNVHIFETLRALNTLLNNSQQVKNRRSRPRRDSKTAVPPVRFVYALRDSIFERIGTDTDAVDAAEEEIRRANRTKFFDLVIPVVPFVTHRNARDVMSQVFDGTDVSARLIALAAGHVADKRLILNLRNEYDVYADRLLHTPSCVPGLKADKLLAILLYKSVHLADFEAIRTGTSRLDALHDAWRDLVEACSADARRKQQAAEARMQPDGSAAARARDLGDRLEEVTREALGQYAQGGFSVCVDGMPYTGEALREISFWSSLARSINDISFNSSYSGARASHSSKGLAVLMGRNLDPGVWAEVDREEQRGILELARENIDFLRHHGWQQLHERTDFTAGVTGEDFPGIVGRLLGSRLARDMVAYGYLDDYFALYVSMYYGEHLRPDALNFIVHTLDRGQPDVSYPLTPEDVEAMLGDLGDGFLQDRAAYNVSILDYLLVQDAERAQVVVQLVSAWGEADQAFAEQYMTTGSNPAAFLRLLTPLTRLVIPFVLEQAVISEVRRPVMVDTVLSHQNPDVEYAHSKKLTGYAASHYRDFPSLVGAPDTVRTQRTVTSLAFVGVELSDVTPLNTDARREVLRQGTYEVTELNLQMLSGGSSIALDILLYHDEKLYRRALSQLAKYLHAVRESPRAQVTVEKPKYFPQALRDACTKSPDATGGLGELVRLASPGCRVSDLSQAPTMTWPALCRHRRTDLSCANLLRYLDAFESFDGDVAALIGSEEHIGFSDDDEVSDRQRIASALLNTGQAVLDAVRRVVLASSLDIAPLSVTALQGQSGELAGLLLEAKLIEDDATVFSSPLVPDWPTREIAIQKSQAFADFCSPEVLPAEEIEAFFRSEHVSAQIQATVLADLERYIDDADENAHVAAATYALRSQAQVTEDLLKTLAEGGAGAQLVVNLMAKAPDLAPEALQRVFRLLGGNYQVIADSTATRTTIAAGPLYKAALDRLRSAGLIRNYRTKDHLIDVHVH